jgi:hypothetical protein
MDSTADFADLYCPDVVLQRKAPTHTMRQRNYVTEKEFCVIPKRPSCEDGIPLTEMDEYFTDTNVFRSYLTSRPIPLGKKDLYDDFVFYIEELCSSKTVTYDKRSNMIKTAYKVPIIGFLKKETVQHSYNSPEYQSQNDDKFIMIHGKLYSLDKYYREVGLEYTEVTIPEGYFSDVRLDTGEHSYIAQKTSCSKDTITFSFHHDVMISSLLIKPEKMTFKNVRGDNTHSRYDRRNTSLMRKQKYCIKVLENEPGFISKFELHYRSELTNGQWVKHGIYNGNVSIADSTKISFDEIQVKEIRIVPISVHKSFDRVHIKFIGKVDVKPKSEEIFVTYEVLTPRDGQYLKYSSKVVDKYSTNWWNESTKHWKYEQYKKRDIQSAISDAMMQ